MRQSAYDFLLTFYSNYRSIALLQKMDNINITKSPGPDSIHPRILYEIRHEIMQPLYVLFNTSYQLGKIPTEWKTSNIVPIYKKETRKKLQIIDQLV